MHAEELSTPGIIPVRRLIHRQGLQDASLIAAKRGGYHAGGAVPGMHFRYRQKGGLAAIHKITPASAMHMKIDEPRRHIFSLRIYFKRIRDVYIAFPYFNDLIPLHYDGSLWDNALWCQNTPVNYFQSDIHLVLFLYRRFPAGRILPLPVFRGSFIIDNMPVGNICLKRNIPHAMRNITQLAKQGTLIAH